MNSMRRLFALLLCAAVLCAMLPNAVLARMDETAQDDEALWSKYWRQYDIDHPEEEPEPSSGQAGKKAGAATTLAAMRARAEALVNYTWTPSSDIDTWNGALYNGKTYFPKGSTVRGVPYTLFVYELVPISLCSLEQYRAVASINYSTTAYCTSVGAYRTGPVYGSCCADLVSEVFGGDFMRDGGPRYHSVYRVRTSPYGTAYFDQKMKDIRAGDALSDTNDDHIIWIGEVTDTTITMYEQTPPAARKRVLDKAAYTNSAGYFVYNRKIYSTITRSNALIHNAAIDIDANGGTKNVSTFKVGFDEAFKLDPGYVARAGYGLQGWTLCRPADGKWFVAGRGWYTEEEINRNGYQKHVYLPKLTTRLDDTWYANAGAASIPSFTFCAVWRRDYTISIDPGGGTANAAAFSVSFGKDCILDPSYVEKEGVGLKGWTLFRPSDGKWLASGGGWYSALEIRQNGDEKRVYGPSDIVTLDDSWLGNAYATHIDEFTIVAQWKTPRSLTVTLDANGGAVPTDTAAVMEGEAYGALPVPDREHYLFDGWYSDASEGNRVTELTEVTASEDHTLYAHWLPDCAEGHAYGYAVTKQPTANAEGILTGTCERCGARTAMRMPALNDADYSRREIAPASCTENGTARFTWTTELGEFSFDVTIPKTEHSFTDSVIGPTCTAQGCTVHACSLCGERDTDAFTAATGHSWDEGVVVREPDESRGGLRRRTCTRCGETRDELFPSYDHTHSYSRTVTEPTCTAQGFTVFACVCGDSYADGYVAAPGHAWDDGAVTEAPTLTDAGIRTYACTRCGATRTEAIPPLPHEHSYAETVVPAACDAQGYTSWQCECGDGYLTDYLPALGHDWDEGVVSLEPTDLCAGTLTRTCVRCGATRDETIPPLPHEHSYAETVISPTCTTGGFVLWRCSCGLSDLTDETAAFGHDYREKTTAATCTERGYTVHTCSHCGDRFVTNDLEPQGHSFSEGFCIRCGARDPDYVEPFRFDDVRDKGKFFFQPVYWAYEASPQITNGVDAAHFAPDRGCTRGQVVTFLWRAAGCPEPMSARTPFTDLKAGAFYEKAVAWAVEKGITKGTSDAAFDPDGKCSRGQIVTFLWRFRGSEEPGSTAAPFTDLKAGAFYEKAVAWAVEKDVTNGTSKTAFSPEDTCTRGQIVTFLYRAMHWSEIA